MPNKPEPAIVKHGTNFYAALKKKAKKQKDGTYLFTGQITHVFRELNISSRFYSPLRTALTDSGCITIVQQGYRDVPSQLVLHRPPTPDDLGNSVLTDRQTAATILDARVKALEQIIGGMDIAKVLIEFDKRLSKLEKEANERRANGKSKKS